MAAGGSAPELVTAFIGTYQESAVGFGTIVGSAVFNILGVIGACALSTNKELKLSWYPLIRDCTFYIIALILVVVMFTTGIENNHYEMPTISTVEKSSPTPYFFPLFAGSYINEASQA